MEDEGIVDIAGDPPLRCQGLETGETGHLGHGATAVLAADEFVFTDDGTGVAKRLEADFEVRPPRQVRGAHQDRVLTSTDDVATNEGLLVAGIVAAAEWRHLQVRADAVVEESELRVHAGEATG